MKRDKKCPTNCTLFAQFFSEFTIVICAAFAFVLLAVPTAMDKNSRLVMRAKPKEGRGKLGQGRIGQFWPERYILDLLEDETSL